MPEIFAITAVGTEAPARFSTQNSEREGHPSARPAARSAFIRWLSLAAVACLFLPACASNLPTLVEVARSRQSSPKDKDNLKVDYTITDRDVLDYTNRIKLNLSQHFSLATGARYGTSAGQTTLAALAGAASVAGWGVATASGLGQGSAFISSLGGVVDAKGDAQAYETAMVDIQRAEANFFFSRVGGKFTTDANGKKHADFSHATPQAGIPDATTLSADGETLYYRVVSVLKVLDDALAKKIPDLQTLKDAKGDTSPTATTTPAH